MTAALLWGRRRAPGVVARPVRAVLWLVMAVILLSLVTSPAMAADNPASFFVWDDISVIVRLQDDGTVRVHEHDGVQFTGGPFRQGFREIPLAAIGDISQVTVTEVGRGDPRPYIWVPSASYSRNAPNTYTYRQVGTSMRIEWSFPETTSATRSFEIEYLARGVIRIYDTSSPPYQEISWIGVDRELTRVASVNKATLSLILPRRVDPRETAAESNGTPFGREDGRTWSWRAEHLKSGATLEASLRFPPLVAATKPSWQDTFDRQPGRAAPVNLAFLGLALLTAVGGGVGLLAAWWTGGRDPLPGPTPDRLTAPPDETPPGVVGALLDEQVDERDYLATVIDLARRDIVRITSVVQPVKSRQQPMVLTLLEPNAPLAPFEKALLEALFARTWWRHAQVRLPLDDPTGMHAALQRVETLLYGELVQRRYFTAPPPDTREWWRYAGIGLCVLAVIVLLAGITVGAALIWVLLASIVLVALGAVAYAVSRHMPQKTRTGAEAAARWRAFRSHMETVDRLGAFEGGQAGFERYLPYAVAFGIERPWINAFARGETASPGWHDVVNLDGDVIRLAGRAGAQIPVPTGGLPGAPGLGGLQNVSSLTSAALQGTSGTLFDMFNQVSFAFRPESVLSNANIDGEDIAEIGFQVLGAVLTGGKGGSGGGGGGFS